MPGAIIFVRQTESNKCFPDYNYNFLLRQFQFWLIFYTIISNFAVKPAAPAVTFPRSTGHLANVVDFPNRKIDSKNSNEVDPNFGHDNHTEDEENELPVETPSKHYKPTYVYSPIKFFLYSTPAPFVNGFGDEGESYDEQLFIGDSFGLKHSRYNPKYPLILLAHGFLSNSTRDDSEIYVLRRAYIETKTKANIIGVDYQSLTAPACPSNAMNPLALFYIFQATKNVPMIASQVTEFILFLLKSGYLPPGGLANVHLVGFSLGAHVVGQAGASLYNMTGTKVDRITGLDPGGITFQFLGKDLVLDASDAKFVDITHTTQGAAGYIGKLGHVDFYMNGGGPFQPACVQTLNPLNLLGRCSHILAYYYYAESIRNPHNYGCKCEGWECYAKFKTNGEKCKTKTVIYGEHIKQRLMGDFNVQMQPVASWN